MHINPPPCRTPLHCAIAYSNLEMLQYLLENGASLFLEAREGETPLRIGMEEYRLQQEAQGYTNPATEECLKCLMGECGIRLRVFPPRPTRNTW